MRNRIREVLAERGITQKELANAIGMTEAGLMKALNGSATQSTIQKAASFLKLPAQDLIIANEPIRAKFGSDKTPLKFGELEIPCYVLENGMRVLSGRGIQRALGSTSPSGSWLSRFVCSGELSTAFSAGENSVAQRINRPIRFIRNNAGGSQSATNGYEATLLIDICSTIIDENRAGVFTNSEIVRQADVIIRSVAKVGIIGLIDEATGYAKEKSRAKDELQKFLSQFLCEEASRWVKTFPDSFFEMTYRINNWTWSNSVARPGYVGQLINDWVYQRVGPLVAEELNRVNPKNENGQRAKKHHQFLTDIGKRKLQAHIEALEAIARVAEYNKGKFEAMLNKAYPRPNEQFTFDFDDI